MTPYDSQSSSRVNLDEPPLSPPARLKPLPTQPGDDTLSLLGAPNVNGEGVGVSASSPTGRALGGVMKMMEGANDIQSVVPGAVPPPVLMMIQELSVILPEIVRNMQQMTGPGGMLSTMGMNDLGAGAGAPVGAGMGMSTGMPMPMPMGEGPRMPGM